MTDTMVRYQEFRLPDVGEGLQDAEIVRWHVGVGDTVTDGQVVCEIETAKAMVELPVPFGGVVRELRFPEGATVDVGEVIITVAPPGAIEAPDASPAATAAPAEPARRPVLVGYGAAASPTARRPRRPVPVPTQAPVPAQAPVPVPVPAERGADRPRAKPPVRKLARDLGVDLERVRPSGPHGDITREDVHTAAAMEVMEVTEARPPQADPTATVPTATVPTETGPADAYGRGDTAHETRIPATAVRRATARAMTASAFGAPHVTEFVTVDVTRTMKLVERLRKDPEFAGVRVSPLLLAVRALLFAVRRHPSINASWDEERQEIVLKHRVNLGIAAATPRGLLVPNIKDAQSLTLPRLAEALDGLVTTAREGRTTPADLGGGTLTVTNIGVFGIDTGTPILNPGEAAILALGAIAPRPWVHRGKVVPRQVTTLALSFDHRLVDGELGSRVLADVAAVLHDPRRLVTHG
ncbi:2-oxo acid dehydrogenase subunit E2 [Streptomyces sp. ISL-36]|uniref:dihydrolipoamide acetyltransferase family protein n=1 Tax=Streptomyces sp. ISL-36 TaxID=2819182 RepID=UPI001BEC8EE3|nr:dihydrolipoamide acetyltransferase family protein [Streptomyces sp. ISL-36]MBT2441081.1 2-oxo acid dehydrogenase subunit E2 [Streptomyces sp. ISL-36]